MEVINPITPGNFIFVVLLALISIAATAYSLYFNWKQSKVKNQMDELLREVKSIHETIRKNGK